MWKIELLPSAQNEFDALSDAVRDEALAIFSELAEDPFMETAAPMRGHRNHFRVRFYRDRFRIIFRLSHSQRKVIVIRIRSRNAATYKGFEVIG